MFSMPIDGIRPAVGGTQSADLIVRNARIHTDDDRLPEAISPSWSPVVRFGGYQALAGVRQGRDLTGAAAESAEQLRRRQRRGLSAGAGVPDLRRYPADPLLGCF